MTRWLRMMTVGVAFGLASCGGGSQYAPVSGRVTLGGQPLAGAKVAFQPVDSGKLQSLPGSIGLTDDDGRFTLAVVSTDKIRGAAIGNHNVVISKMSGSAALHEERPNSQAPKELVPAKYNEKSVLMFEVPKGGTEDANFTLE